MRTKGDEKKMKKIGEYTARGIISEQETEAGTPQKIMLFDGRFDTAYKVVGFKIWSVNYSSNTHSDAIGKLSKNAIGTTSSATFMRADDDNQIAWAGTQSSVDGGGAMFEVVDPDNLIVEDLYVYARHGGATGPVNYLVVMEKYEINEWKGALAMSRDKADGE